MLGTFFNRSPIFGRVDKVDEELNQTTVGQMFHDLINQSIHPTYGMIDLNRILRSKKLIIDYRTEMEEPLLNNRKEPFNEGIRHTNNAIRNSKKRNITRKRTEKRRMMVLEL